MTEAFISEVTISNEHGRIAILKHFDGDSFEVELANSISTSQDMKDVASTLENLSKHYVNLVINKPFEENK